MAYTNADAFPASFAPQVTIYTVEQGDSFYTIAYKVYGASEPGWITIMEANNIIDPRTLFTGQVLLIP
jgi:nucleoid-associated protein YgaU